LVIHLADEAATLRAGAAVAEIALPGAWIALEGPLGAGKTTLARGIARGLGLDEEVPVTSPTFALVQEYETRPRFVQAICIGSPIPPSSSPSACSRPWTRGRSWRWSGRCLFARNSASPSCFCASPTTRKGAAAWWSKVGGASDSSSPYAPRLLVTHRSDKPRAVR